MTNGNQVVEMALAARGQDGHLARMLRFCTLFVLAAFGQFGVAPLQAKTLSGKAVVVDGDTLKVAGDTVRLLGIDAPERKQSCTMADGAEWRCGGWADGVLRGLVDDRTVICEGDVRDRYGRLVARCRVHGGDLGQGMVQRGAARAYRRYSTDYVADEAMAVAARVGVWQGEWVSPSLYRQRSVAAPVAAPSDCQIKGNISASGRIYHQPGQRDYDRTRITPGKGERWFCTRAEAEIAGWRPARR